MKKQFFTLLIFSLVLTSCGKIREAQQAFSELSEMARAVQNVTETYADMDFENLEVDATNLTEKQMRDYYQGVMALSSKYPDIEFQNPPIAAFQAQTKEMDLKAMVAQETNMSFDEYNAYSMQILTVMTQGALGASAHEFSDALDQSIRQLETMDTSNMSPEQKEALTAQIEAQRSSMSEYQQGISDPEIQKYKDQFQTLMKVRNELGIE